MPAPLVAAGTVGVNNCFRVLLRGVYGSRIILPIVDFTDLQLVVDLSLDAAFPESPIPQGRAEWVAERIFDGPDTTVLI